MGEITAPKSLPKVSKKHLCEEIGRNVRKVSLMQAKISSFWLQTGIPVTSFIEHLFLEDCFEMIRNALTWWCFC